MTPLRLCLGASTKMEKIKFMRDKLEIYYNKFNEDKRLGRRHGNVEFQVTFSYVLKYLEQIKSTLVGFATNTESAKSDKKNNSLQTENAKIKIADIGAGTGRYSIPLHNLGYDVLAVEPYKCNLNKLKNNEPTVKTMLGNAINLKKIADCSVQMCLLFGPMYHLGTKAEKLQALKEAIRITVPGGIIMVAYISNDYSVVTHGFKSHKIAECIKKGQLDDKFCTQYTEEDLYSYMSLAEIDELMTEVSGVERIKILGTDGPTEYMRREINEMDENEYNLFIEYVKSVAERQDLIGASAHIVDVIKKG